MYVTKTPKYRINESDLRCKNGCDYFGNAAWQGYCSVCHRSQQRNAQGETEKTSQVHERLAFNFAFRKYVLV